jgi:hypothetical protein
MGDITVTNFRGMLVLGCSALALAGCGADDIASPGAGSITITNPAPAPTPTPTPTDTGVVAADSCPGFNATGGLTDSGIIQGPEGSWRVCTLPALVDVSSSLPQLDGVIYRVAGRVDVGCDGGPVAPSGYVTTTASCAGRTLNADTNVTLTIDPGVIVYGENGTGPAWIAVNRGNKILAEGTATTPIIFTSRQNVIGTNSDSSDGQWGGVVLLGRGRTTDCAVTSTVQGTAYCERDTEGAADLARFGGNDNTYNAGTMKYVQIRYSGFVLGANSELQSLTGGGVGTGTTRDCIMAANSSDDGSEWFGGAVRMKHYIAVNADDDSLDLDTGVQGQFQYLLLLQRSADNDSFFEIDSDGLESETPRSVISIANFTAVQPKQNNNSNSAAIRVRGNSDVTFANGVVFVPENECLRLTGTGATSATIRAFSTVMTCADPKYIASGTYSLADVQGQFGSGSNNNNDAFTSTLSNVYVNGTNEAGVTAYDASTLSSYFTATSYIGAVRDASDTWYAGWTCNTSTASFGSVGNCTAIPVF